MSAKAKTVSWIMAPTLVIVIGGMWVIGSYFRLWTPEVPAAQHVGKIEKSAQGNIDEALQLMHRARDKFAGVKDYTATYLRDEFIDGEMRKNQILLKVMHEPFSVYMEWKAPRAKSGRKAAYIEGQNNGRMVVKDLITLRLDPEQSIKRRESRHTILEAGMKNMIKRFSKSWEEEKRLGRTEVKIQDGEVRVEVQAKEFRRPCRVVTTIHEPQDKERFAFYAVNIFFDKETHLPIRMQGFDWPENGEAAAGRLMEDYTYLEMQTNVGLTEGDFKW